jgi:hypothetical protein
MTVMPAANSLEALAEVRKAMDIDDDEAAPEFEWHIGEWKYEAWKADNFRSISSELRDELKNTDFEIVARQLHLDMVAALQLLRDEHFFEDSEHAVIFISISDDDAFQVENESAKKLNSNTVCGEFFRRYD